MARHRAHPAPRWMIPAVVVLGLTALLLASTLIDRGRRDGGAAPNQSPCDRTVRVVTAASFAPVLTALAPTLENDIDCVRLKVEVADGRAAAAQVAQAQADVWIPDDASWAGSASAAALAQEPTAGAGTVLATSPIYMVTDQATGDRLRKAGGSWLALADMLAKPTGVRLVIRDPGSSGDGMVAAGTVAEAVWIDQDMDASALWLAQAQKVTRTVTGADPALPAKPGEVGLVAEYALLPALRQSAVTATVLASSDYTATLRYTWLPTAAAVADPARAAALERLRQELTGPGATAALNGARLRAPEATMPPGEGGSRLPKLVAKPLRVLKPHHVDHVFATWYVGDRRTNLLVVVDVSGSMAQRAPGSKTPLIELVRQGCRSLGRLLPADAQLGLWKFGVGLDGKRDHRELLPTAPLDPRQRQALSTAVGDLRSQKTGTGLYDTILAAYTSARDSHRPGVSNQVLVFTDGRNEDDPNSITATQLAAQLAAARDPGRPVQLSVVAFGQRPEAKILEDAVKPVEGYVDAVATADEVAAVFIHVAAGGLHH